MEVDIDMSAKIYTRNRSPPNMLAPTQPTVIHESSLFSCSQHKCKFQWDHQGSIFAFKLYYLLHWHLVCQCLSSLIPFLPSHQCHFYAGQLVTPVLIKAPAIL